MAEKLKQWICSYDVCHPKRLNKIHTLLSMLGIAINYSVFYLSLTQPQYKKLCQDLQKIVRPEDDIRLYRCQQLYTAEFIGTLSPTGIHLIGHQGILF